jgi:KH domain
MSESRPFDEEPEPFDEEPEGVSAQATAGSEAEPEGVAPEGGEADEGGFDRRTTPEEVADTAREFVAGLLEALGIPADVAASAEGDRALVEVTGDDLGVLIGRRGQTLDALQEVTRTAVQRRLRSRLQGPAPGVAGGVRPGHGRAGEGARHRDRARAHERLRAQDRPRRRGRRRRRLQF